MADSSFDAVVGAYGQQGVVALKKTLEASWAAFSAEERADAEDCIVNLVRYHFLDVIGQPVQVELAIWKVTFENWTATGKQVIADAAKATLTEMLGLAGAFAGSALAGFIKGIK